MRGEISHKFPTNMCRNAPENGRTRVERQKPPTVWLGALSLGGFVFESGSAEDGFGRYARRARRICLFRVRDAINHKVEQVEANS